MIIQFCGLSGSGKTTLAQLAKRHFEKQQISIEVIDGDEYRKGLCADLGYTKDDRNKNIRRLAFIANRFSQYKIIPIICAINPYETIRQEVSATYTNVKTVYIKCSISELIRRDTKGLYAKSLLPQEDRQKLNNFSGINDVFDVPLIPDCIIETDRQTVEESTERLIRFIDAEL